jgi:hypothetical protein
MVGKITDNIMQICDKKVQSWDWALFKIDRGLYYIEVLLVGESTDYMCKSVSKKVRVGTWRRLK